MPDSRTDLKTDVNAGAFAVAWSEEDRDRQVAQWGVHKPYVLFARHPNMGNGWGLQFPVTGGKRWNEMVIYPQIQENLILTIRMTDSELNDEIMRQNHLHYENQLAAWGITVPQDTRNDFRAHSENF